MKKILVAAVLTLTLLISSVSYGLIEKFYDPCDETWVNGETYIHYILYRGKDLMNPNVMELAPLDDKMCRDDVGAFIATYFNGVKGYIHPESGQFIDWEDVQ